MRKLTVVLALVALAAGTASAQQSWNSEIGIQGGYARLARVGTGQYADLFDLPGFSLSPLLQTYGTVYAILPWKDKIALEPAVAFSQGNVIGSDVTFFNFGLRADYALSPKFYAAAGGTLGWLETGGTHETQFGLQAAVGYRMHLTGSLNARLEGYVSASAKTDVIPPTNVYGLLFGVSHRTSGAAAPARRGSASTSLWDKTFGMSGGYTRTHGVGGGGDVTNLAFPGYGAGLIGIGAVPVAGPPTVFAIFPVGRKLALEPGVDLHRTQGSGTTTFAGNLQGRLNYALSGGWYAAAGGNLIYVKTTGLDAETISGANAAFGYRFHLLGGLGGRVEANYTMMGTNSTLGVPALNTFGLMFGTTMSLR